MSGRLLLIISLIFAFLQGPVLPPVFVEGFLVVFYCLTASSLYLVTRTARLGLPLLLSGLVFDLVQNQRLGVTSLIFLGSLGLVLFLRGNVALQRSFVLAAFAAAIGALREKILFGYIEPLPLILVFGFAYLIFNLIWRPEFSGKIRI